MTALGLDSAARTGWALVSGPKGRERLLRHGTLAARSARDVAAAVADLGAFGPDLVVIEAPFIRIGAPGRGGNATTGLALATLLGRWLQAWEGRGVRTATVLASTWQLGLLAGLITGRSDRPARKAAARRWAQATFGADLGEDEADAAGIATWALRREAWEVLTATGGAA